MIKGNLLTIAIISLIFIFGAAAQSNCDKKKKEQNTDKNTAQNAINDNKMQDEKPEPEADESVKTLAQGSYGEITEPFLYVARDAESYAGLKNLLTDLPASDIDFSKQAVVAAFAGTKNTGGYSVEIRKIGEKVLIFVNEPPKDALVTEALTMPYKVAAVPVEAENSLHLDVTENWKKAAQTFSVSSGTFESSGGITGRRKSFAVEGTIDAFYFRDLVTLDFNLAGQDAGESLKLTETASGILSGGKIVLPRVDAGSFSEGPKPPVKVSGIVSNGRLVLNFEPLPSNVPDGFQVGGKLEAVRDK